MASWCHAGDDVWLGDDDGVPLIDRRLDDLARSVAERIAGDAARASVVCTTEAPSLRYDSLMARFSTLARLHDLTILDAEPLAVLSDRDLIEAVLLVSGRPLIMVPLGRAAFWACRIVVA